MSRKTESTARSVSEVTLARQSAITASLVAALLFGSLAASRHESADTDVQPASSPSPAPSATRSGDDERFRSFTYPWPTELAKNALGAGFTLHDGTLESTLDFPADYEKYRIGSLGAELSAVEYGDVTADGRDEALVVVSVATGGSSNLHVTYVYGLAAESPVLLASFADGDRANGGLRRVYAEDGELVAELYGRGRTIETANDELPTTPACCPKVITKSRYRWTGRAFERTNSTIIENEDGDARMLMGVNES